MHHTAGHLLDQAKEQWLAERSDASHLRASLDMARARIKRYEALFAEIEGEYAADSALIARIRDVTCP